jgi:DNA repair protein SbcC/Rad50
VRFGLPADVGPDDFSLPEREQIPGPDGVSPEAYAALLGVWRIDPWEDPGAIHLFHLLRDDLPRMHQLMSEWRLLTPGQLELFLGSSAAEHAVPDPDARRHLQVRCRVSRLWVEAWRLGRGRPIDRSTLERSGAVSHTFPDRVSDLSRTLEGDPRALLLLLPEIPRFRRSKIGELETWLVEHGYLSIDKPLETREREARALQDATGLLEPGEIREVVRWLEAGSGWISAGSHEAAGG